MIPRREVICLLARLLEGQFQDMQFIYTEGSVSETKADYITSDQNNSYEIAIDGFQVRKINEIRIKYTTW